MTLLSPAALYLLCASAGIVLLYSLHTRSRRQEVSDLFLWEGLESEPRSRAARIRMKLDPILLLELLVLTLVAFALAGPALRVAQPHLAGDGVSIQLSYVVPIYTFRQEGGFVIDALTYQTNVVNQRFPAELARLK